MLDTIGQILWWATFIAPLIIIPTVWFRSKDSKIWRLIWGLALSLLISAIFFFTSLGIVLHNGLGA